MQEGKQVKFSLGCPLGAPGMFSLEERSPRKPGSLFVNLCGQQRIRKMTGLFLQREKERLTTQADQGPRQAGQVTRSLSLGCASRCPCGSVRIRSGMSGPNEFWEVRGVDGLGQRGQSLNECNCGSFRPHTDWSATDMALAIPRGSHSDATLTVHLKGASLYLPLAAGWVSTLPTPMTRRGAV